MKQIFCLALLIAATVARAALPAAERLLPADTLAVATIPDWQVAKTNFNASAYGQFFSDPAMKPFREKLLANFGKETTGAFEKELGIKLVDFADLVRGQVTVALTRNKMDAGPDNKPGFLWLIDARDKSSQARTNLADWRKKWTDKGQKLRAEKIRDTEFITFIIPPENKPAPADATEEKPKPAAPTELSIGISGTLIVFTDVPKDAEKVLALQAGSSVPPLADQANFAANLPLVRGSTAFLWADVKTFVSLLAKQIAAEAKQDQASLLGPAPSFDRILSALGLADVQTICANYQITGDGTAANIAINVPESGRKGVFKILAVDQKDASPPPFVPADVAKFSRWRIDLQKAWNSIENVLMEISPQSAGVLKLVLDSAGKDKDMNFDLRKVLLANLGDDVISYEKPAKPGDEDGKGPSLTLVGSKNAEQMATSLKALTSIIPPSMAKYEERDFLGRKIASFTWPSFSGGKATPIVYSASGGYVVISSEASLVEEYLRSNEGKNKPLRETAGLNEAAQKVGGMNTGYFSYENQSESMRASFEAAKKNPSAALSLPGAGQLGTALTPKNTTSTTNWFDPSLLPAFEKVSKYFDKAVSAVNVSPNAITFKMFTPTPAALKK